MIPQTSHNQQRYPLVLALDTSCDDTSAAVMQGNRVLSNVIASQTDLHRPYGGVFPTVAKQAHKENIEPTVSLALKRAGVSSADLDCVAVTQGPGLAPALEVGLNFAKNLANTLQKPLVAVNHIEGHALSPWAVPKTHAPSRPNEIAFPILSLVISGGHSQFILLKNIGEYEILGTTIDDAAGEALDKIGRMLNLGYPAGPVIEQLAKQGNSHAYTFPLPMTTVKNYNLSFSGLKTYARNLLEEIEEKGGLNKTQICDFTASAQRSIFRHIIYKLNKLLDDYEVNEIWLGGGVAANVELRKMIRTLLKKRSRNAGEKTKKPLPLRIPYTKKLCADNAAMIGLVAGYKFQNSEVLVQPEKLDRRPRWKIGEQ